MRHYIKMLCAALLTLAITPACKKKDAPKKDYLDGKTFEFVLDLADDEDIQKGQISLSISFNHPRYIFTAENETVYKEENKAEDKVNQHQKIIQNGVYAYASGKLNLTLSSGITIDVLAKKTKELSTEEIKETNEITRAILVDEKSGTLTIEGVDGESVVLKLKR